MSLSVIKLLAQWSDSESLEACLCCCDVEDLHDVVMLDQRTFTNMEEFLRLRCSKMSVEQRRAVVGQSYMHSPAQFMFSPKTRVRVLSMVDKIKRLLSSSRGLTEDHLVKMMSQAINKETSKAALSSHNNVFKTLASIIAEVKGSCVAEQEGIKEKENKAPREPGGEDLARQGPRGSTADQGPRGSTADQGPRGSTADQGPRGSTADQGPRGSTADQGPRSLKRRLTESAHEEEPVVRAPKFPKSASPVLINKDIMSKKLRSKGHEDLPMSPLVSKTVSAKKVPITSVYKAVELSGTSHKTVLLLSKAGEALSLPETLLPPRTTSELVKASNQPLSRKEVKDLQYYDYHSPEPGIFTKVSSQEKQTDDSYNKVFPRRSRTRKYNSDLFTHSTPYVRPATSKPTPTKLSAAIPFLKPELPPFTISKVGRPPSISEDSSLNLGEYSEDLTEKIIFEAERNFVDCYLKPKVDFDISINQEKDIRKRYFGHYHCLLCSSKDGIMKLYKFFLTDKDKLNFSNIKSHLRTHFQLRSLKR